MSRVKIIPSEKTTLVYTDEDNAGEYKYKTVPCVSVLLDGKEFVSHITKKEADSVVRLLENEDSPVINNSGISLWP